MFRLILNKFLPLRYRKKLHEIILKPIMSARFEQKKHFVVKLAIHLLAIFVYLILPEIMMNMAEPRHDSIPTGVYVKVLSCLLLFYFNYLFLFDYSFNGRHKYEILRFVVLNFILLLFVMGANYIVWLLTASHLPIHGETIPGFHKPGEQSFYIMDAVRMLRDGVVFVSVIGLSVAIKFTRRWSVSGRKYQEMLARQREDELRELRSQINPHFLFNTLNSIYALIDISASKSKQAVHTLSKMMRYLLYETNENVTISRELEFVRCYVEMMKVRLGDKMPLNVVLDDGGQGSLVIAPALFTAIVENIFKHGNTGNSNQQMNLSIEVKNGVVYCYTFNYFNPEQKSKPGIGLENLSRRLQLLYGDNAGLTIVKDENTFTLNMKIDLNHNNRKR